MSSWCLDFALSCATDADCNDGDPCTSDTCVGSICQHSGIGTPGEVTGDAFPTKTTYTWSATAGAASYDVVRGLSSALPVGPGGGDETCFPNIVGTSLTDATTPSAPGDSLFYLARAKNTCAPAGTYGTTSGGSPRTTTTCP